MFKPWWDLGMLAAESQQVIWLRYLRLAAGGSRASAEARRMVSEKVAVATVAGAILPGGPFTIYPVAGSFLAAGADVGAACAFVISWTLIGYTRAIVWELPFFGLDFVTWRIIFSLPLPILAGLAARAAWRLMMRKEGAA